MTNLLLSAPVTLQQPPRIHFGAGCASPAIQELARAGHRRVFVVTSASLRIQATALVSLLGAAGAVIDYSAPVPPEPTAAVCEQLRATARKFAPDLVLGVGGGSVLDVAKLVAALHHRSEPLAQFYGIGRLTGPRRTTLACVPATAGTGSEVSPNALLFDETTSTKQAVISAALIPDVAIVDPQLMLSLPPALTATTGIDALSHCLEAYTNRAAHPAIDLYALEGVRLIGTHLVRAVADGSDLTARSAVALGSLYGGLCLGPVNTAGVHALAYPLGGEFHLPHGLSIALLLPAVTAFNLSAAPARHAALARALGSTAAGDDAAHELPGLLERLLVACRVPRGLGHHGIPREALTRMVDSAMKVTRLLKNNPREITRDDALRLYEASY